MAQSAWQKSVAIERKWIEGINDLEQWPLERLLAVYKRALKQLIDTEVKPLAKRLGKATGEDAEALAVRLTLAGSRAQSIKQAALAALEGSGLAEQAAKELEPLAKAAYNHGAAVGYGKMKAVGVAHGRVNDDQVRRFLGRLQPQTVANNWVRSLTGDWGVATVNKMVQGVALGYGPDQLVRSVSDSLGGASARVRTFVRTETINAARQGNLDSYRRNAGVVTGWVWNATASACMICQGKNGSFHPLDEQMFSHPNCRCSADPATEPMGTMEFLADVDWLPDGVPGYEGALSFNPNSRFAKLPADQQRRILGPTRWHAWQAGNLDLRQIPKQTMSNEWGPGLRAARLDELGLTKGNYPPGSVLDSIADQQATTLDALEALSAADEEVSQAVMDAAEMLGGMFGTEASSIPALKASAEGVFGSDYAKAVDYLVKQIEAKTPPKPKMEWTPDPVKAPEPAPPAPAAAPPAMPPSPILEWEGELTFHRALTGSSHGGKVLKDSAGTRYAFKPALGDKWIVEAENAAAQLADALYVPVPKSRMITFDGQYGQIQEYLQGASNFVEGTAWSADEANQIIVHHLFDWLIGNHDGHKDNFLWKDGRLWGIDKGQSWKFIKTDRLDLGWVAPGNIGTPVYKRFWKDWLDGRAGFNTDGTLADLQLRPPGLIARLDAMSAERFRQLIDPYVDALPVSAAEKAKVATAMLRRKDSLSQQWDEFIKGLEAERAKRLNEAAKAAGAYPIVNTDVIDGYASGNAAAQKHLGWWRQPKADAKPGARTRATPQYAVDRVKSYTGSYYHEMNENGRDVLAGRSAPSEAVKGLDRFIKDAPKVGKKWYVYRGYGYGFSKAFKFDDERFSTLDDLEQLIGKQVQEGGFLSTSRDMSEASKRASGFFFGGKSVKVVVRLRNKAKTSIAPVEDISSYKNEREVILPRGMNLKVVGATMTGPKAELDALFGMVRGKHKWLRRDDTLSNRQGSAYPNNVTLVIEVDTA